MLSRRNALTRARQYRNCPPPQVFEAADQQDDLKQHLRICPYCEDRGSLNDRHVWSVFTRKLREVLLHEEKRDQPDTVREGQIRFIKSDLGHWRDRRYFNPPCVLVTEVSEVGRDRISVAQLYHDITLAGPGDLILSAEQTGCFELFVECWHTYTCRLEHLGPPVGEVRAEILGSIKAMKKDPGKLPDWALLPIPMKEHDARLYFRELEVEVGFVFASLAVGEILAEMDTAPQFLDYETIEALQQDIRETAEVIQFRPRAAGLEEALASARFPAEHYAKAAADIDDERERLAANLVVLYNGKVKAFKPIQGIITSKTREKDALSVSGAFPALPALEADPRIACFYWSKATGVMVPDDMHWEVMTGTFYARFKVDTPEEGTLEFALLYEIGDA